MPSAILRRRVEESALHLFKQSGFDGVSVDQIVARAGVSKGTFFLFFPTKADAGSGRFASRAARSFARRASTSRKLTKGALLFVHGSGPGPRRAYDIWSNFFLGQGWAVVVYDKRGSGESTGDWHEANFETLASCSSPRRSLRNLCMVLGCRYRLTVTH